MQDAKDNEAKRRQDAKDNKAKPVQGIWDSCRSVAGSIISSFIVGMFIRSTFAGYRETIAAFEVPVRYISMYMYSSIGTKVFGDKDIEEIIESGGIRTKSKKKFTDVDKRITAYSFYALYAIVVRSTFL